MRRTKSASHCSLAREEWPRQEKLPLRDLLFQQAGDNLRSALLAVPSVRPVQRVRKDNVAGSAFHQLQHRHITRVMSSFVRRLHRFRITLGPFELQHHRCNVDRRHRACRALARRLHRSARWTSLPRAVCLRPATERVSGAPLRYVPKHPAQNHRGHGWKTGNHRRHAGWTSTYPAVHESAEPGKYHSRGKRPARCAAHLRAREECGARAVL